MTFTVQNTQPFTSSSIALSTIPFRGDPATRDRWVQRSMVYSYATAFGQVERELDALMSKWQDAKAAGQPVSPSWAMRQERYQRLMTQYHDAILKYGMDALTLTSAGMRDAVAAAINYTPREVKEAAGTAPTGFLGAGFDSETWNTVNHAMLTNMTAFLNNQSSPLRKLFEELGTDTFNAVRQTMMQGLGMGVGPKKLATRIKNTTADIALGRARVIARTEYHRAYRYAKREQFMASPVIKGWVWRARMVGSCGVCLAMSGSVHPQNEVLESHPNCRCVMVPLTKSWEELGFPGAEAGVYGHGPGGLGIDNLDKWVRDGNISKAMAAFGKQRFKLLVDDVLNTGNWSTSARKFVQQTMNPKWGGGRKLMPVVSRTPKVIQTAITIAKGAVSFLTSPIRAALSEVEQMYMTGKGGGRPFLRMPWKYIPGSPGLSYSGSPATNAKNEVATALGDSLLANHFDQLLALEPTSYFSVRHIGNWYTYQLPKMWTYMDQAERRAWLTTADNGKMLAREIASEMVQTWAGTSGDSNPLSVLMQRAAQEELGLAGEYKHLGGWDQVDMGLPLFALAKSFIRDMYEYTQAQFAAQGITEVYLARGIGYDTNSIPSDWRSLNVGDGKTSTATGQPLSSWAADPDIAKGFTGHGYSQFILTARIPVEWIVGSARTGFGCYSETEFVVATPRSFEVEVFRRK